LGILTLIREADPDKYKRLFIEYNIFEKVLTSCNTYEEYIYQRAHVVGDVTLFAYVTIKYHTLSSYNINEWFELVKCVLFECQQNHLHSEGKQSVSLNRSIKLSLNCLLLFDESHLKESKLYQALKDIEMSSSATDENNLLCRYVIRKTTRQS